MEIRTIFLRNTTASSITFTGDEDTFVINALSDGYIWQPGNVDAFNNFYETLEDQGTLSSNMSQGNLVMYIDGIAQTSSDAFKVYHNLKTIFGSYNNEALETANAVTLAASTSAAISGNGYQYIESQSESTTTSSSYQTKILLTTNTLTGTYLISWTCNLGKPSGTTPIYCRVYNTTDSVDIGGEWSKDQLSSTDRLSFSGFSQVTFSNNSKSFEIQYRGNGDNTASIKMAKLAIWRVS